VNYAGPIALEKGVPRLCRATLILNLGFKRVACPGLQALPLGSAHQPIYGEATSLVALVQRVYGRLGHRREH